MFKGQRVICKKYLFNSSGSRPLLKIEIMLCTNKLDASQNTCLNKNTNFLNFVSKLKQFGIACYWFSNLMHFGAEENSDHLK